jgi:hypothetical protein
VVAVGAETGQSVVSRYVIACRSTVLTVFDCFTGQFDKCDTLILGQPLGDNQMGRDMRYRSVVERPSMGAGTRPPIPPDGKKSRSIT